MPLTVPFGIVIDKPAMPTPAWFKSGGNNPALSGRFREAGQQVQGRSPVRYRPVAARPPPRRDFSRPLRQSPNGLLAKSLINNTGFEDRAVRPKGVT